jgi:hypothetical protein
MKKMLSIKIFAYAVAISALFLSCSTPDDGQNAISSSSNIQLSSSEDGLPSSSSLENPSSSSLEGMPVWNSRVVSYRYIGYPYELGIIGFAMGEDTLKLWFPDILDNEQASECNYFAIYHRTSSSPLDYMIISQDMAVYTILPSRYALTDSNEVFPYPPVPGCGTSEDIVYHAALICDDEAGTLRNNIDISHSPIRYIDQDWNCNEEWVGVNKDVFF